MRGVTYILLLFLSQSLLAHGPLHEQINDVTNQLHNHPDDIDYLVKRGRLKFENRAFSESIDDFKLVLALNPEHTSAHYYLAETYLALKNTQEALRHIGQFINLVTGDAAKVRGYATLAHIHLHSADYASAAQAYEALLNATKNPKPEYYLNLASAYFNVNKSALAMQILDRGLRELGPLPVLQKKAIEYAEKAENLESALNRASALIKSNPNSFAFLKLKADILWRNKKIREAKTVYQASLDLFDQLPLSRKNSAAMRKIRREMSSRL